MPIPNLDMIKCMYKRTANVNRDADQDDDDVELSRYYCVNALVDRFNERIQQISNMSFVWN